MKRYRWDSPVSTVEEPDILLRGYPIQEVMEHLSYSDATYLILKGETPSKEKSEVLRTCLNAILDYAMGPAPFASRIVASANPNLGAAMAAGILAQGKYAVSPQDTGEFLLNSLEVLKEENGDYESAALTIVKSVRESKQRIPGLGHPSTLGIDPRAKRIEETLKEQNLWNETAILLETIQNVWHKETGKPLVINVDGMLGIALLTIGFEPLEMSGIAAISMLPGIIANAVYEINHGVPIRQIADMEYTGEPKRSLTANR